MTDYRPPQQKLAEQHLAEIIKAILKQYPDDSRYFYDAAEYAIFSHYDSDWRRGAALQAASMFIRGLNLPGAVMEEEKEPAPVPVVRRRGRPRKQAAQELPANVITFKPRAELAKEA